MNVPLCLVTIFFKTLPINFDETFRVLSRLPEDGTETFWENSIHKQNFLLRHHFSSLEMGRVAALLASCYKIPKIFVKLTERKKVCNTLQWFFRESNCAQVLNMQKYYKTLKKLREIIFLNGVLYKSGKILYIRRDYYFTEKLIIFPSNQRFYWRSW